MRTTDLGVSAISRRIGYESEEAFSRAFSQRGVLRFAWLALGIAGAGVIGGVADDGGVHRRGVQQPSGRGQHAWDQAGQRGHAPHLIEQDVAPGVADHLLATGAVEVKGDLVSHGAGGDEQRRTRLATEVNGRWFDTARSE